MCTQIMKREILLLVILIFFLIVVGLFTYVIIAKSRRIRRSEKTKDFRDEIQTDLQKVLSGEIPQITHVEKVRTASHSDLYQETYELILLERIENGDEEESELFRSLAYDLGLPNACKELIESQNIRKITEGSRKAGLYRYDKVIPALLIALKTISGEAQIQILLALSRIGNAWTLKWAFDEISEHVMINQRAANEILEAFIGDKLELYRDMICHDEDYIAALFLRSIDEKIAHDLSDTIGKHAKHGSKELRVASAYALGVSKNVETSSYLKELITDVDWEVRAQAAKALGKTVCPEIADSLVEASSDREWWVRQNAVQTLLSYPNSKELLLSIISRQDAYACDSVLYVLEGQKGDDYSEVFSRALEAKREMAHINDEDLSSQKDIIGRKELAC